MRIITLWQPWTSLIAYGLKQYETRSWKTNYCGPLLIHAAKRPFVHPVSNKVLCRDCDRAWLNALELGYEAGLIDGHSRLANGERLPFAYQLPLGAVVAVATLDGCYEMRPGIGATVINYEPPKYEPGESFTHIDMYSDLERSTGDWKPGCFAWQLNDVQRLSTPVSWRGSQGLRTVPQELRAAIATTGKEALR